MDSPYTVAPARPDEQEHALRLLFGDLIPEEREQRLIGALRLLRAGELDPQGLLVERGDSGLAGVLVCLPVPGASALFWPPRSIADAQQVEREDRLLARGLAWVCANGAKLSQSLLTLNEEPLARPLLRNGFQHVTRLWYLAHDLNLTVTQLATSDRLVYRSYAPDVASCFEETLQRTYEGTRDCPEVNGVRTMTEVIAGHRAQGRFDPKRWWLAFDDGKPVGVMLLADMPEGTSLDVSYVGVVPEARRRGFAREMLVRALCEAKAADVGRVTLSVDGRNDPALNLYKRLGFLPYDWREVYLAILANTSQPCPPRARDSLPASPV